MVTRWAMKLRLPKVPPGARVRLARSVVISPYAWIRPVAAPTTTAAASAARICGPWPARASVLATQKSPAPASETPRPRVASHPLVANSAESTESARNPATSTSTMNTVILRAEPMHSRAAARAAPSSTSSFTKV